MGHNPSGGVALVGMPWWLVGKEEMTLGGCLGGLGGDALVGMPW